MEKKGVNADAKSWSPRPTNDRPERRKRNFTGSAGLVNDTISSVSPFPSVIIRSTAERKQKKRRSKRKGAADNSFFTGLVADIYL